MSDAKVMLEAERSRARAPEQAPQLRVIAGEPSGPPHWTGLVDAGNEAVFCSAWLASQCAHISGITAGLLMMPPPAKGRSVASTSWPERNPYLKDLMRLAERASLERRALISPGRAVSENGAPQAVGIFLALPLGPGNEPIGMVAVALASGSSAALAPEKVAEQLRWGAGWLESLPWALRSKMLTSDAARAASCMDLLAAIGEQPRLHGTAMALANDLAARLRCDRVSVGVTRRNGSVRLRAISHSASFRGQGRLVDAIENAMEEALDQRSSIAYPPLPGTERAVTMARAASVAGACPMVLRLRFLASRGAVHDLDRPIDSGVDQPPLAELRTLSRWSQREGTPDAARISPAQQYWSLWASHPPSVVANRNSTGREGRRYRVWHGA